VKRLLVWYLPQAACFVAGYWFAMQIEANGATPTSGMAKVFFGVMLAAAYTGGANLIISLVARLRRHKGKPSGDSLGLIGARGGSSETAEHRERIRIGK